jgi:hypothetical protein
MQEKPRIFFLCWQLPHWGTQSGPVLFRHLLRLRDRYQVSCIYHSGDVPPDYPFQVLQVPARRKLWPPHRDAIPGSRYIRDLLVARYIAQSINLTSRDKLVLCLHTREHVIARMLCRKYGAPLYCIIHDIWPQKHHNEIVATLRYAKHIFPVSNKLLDYSKRLGASAGEVLLPIGEGFITSEKQPRSDSLVLGIAGSLNKASIEVGVRLADRVLVIGPTDAWPKSDQKVQFVPRFEKNRDALSFLGANCTTLLVHVPSEANSEYSSFAFPSKLIDFAQTGLPLIICTPEETNLGKWASQNGWTLWLKHENDVETMAQIKSRLRNYQHWKVESIKVRQLAITQFSPESIHRQFESKLGL